MVPSLSGHSNSYGETKKRRHQLQISSPRIRSNLLPVPMQGFYNRENLGVGSDSESYVPIGSSTNIPGSTTGVPTTATTSFSEGNTQTSSPIPRKYQQRPSSSSIAKQSSLGSGSLSGVKSPPSNRFLKSIQSRSAINKQQSLPQSIFRRQCAIDVPTRASLANPTIILSPNNSFESTALSTCSQPPAVVPTNQAQKLRKEWSNRQPTSSVNSSLQSNGDIKSSYFKGSRKSSLFDIRDAARRRFSLIPAVSCLSRDVHY